MSGNAVPSNRLARAQVVASRLSLLPQVTAVAISGSQTAGLSDVRSDLDLYVYIDAPIPADTRQVIAHEFAAQDGPRIEIDNTFWGSEDTWVDRASGLSVELIYWAPEWIEDQVERPLARHQAWLGYTTSFWYTVSNSQPLYDRTGWFGRLKQRAESPYPEPLRRSIVAWNYPVLREVKSSYRQQIELAILRRDRISVNHRITALLASYFDILFAVNYTLNPGEKRLIAQTKRLCVKLPEHWESQLETLLCGTAADWEQQRTLDHVDALLNSLDRLLIGEGLIKTAV